MTTVHVRAPGKVNIALLVGSQMRDGFHPLATVFQAVSLYEDVIASSSDEFTVEVTGRDAHVVPLDRTNLALRAAKLLADATGYSGGAHLHVIKGVPTAGGMGGGSADAAATLLACDLLWGTGLAREELGELASELGSDVPFALTGQTALGIGRGDVLTPAMARGHFTWVLAIAHSGLSTPEVFAEWDRQNPARRPAPQIGAPLMQALISGDPHEVALHMDNELSDAAVALRPQLRDVLDVFGQTSALAAIISGSGPTVAALAASAEEAEQIAAQVRQSGTAREALVVTGPVPGARLVESVLAGD